MPDRVKTSFIPKKSLQTERKSAVRQTTFGVVNTIAAVILIAAILAAAGMFFFENFTKSSITNKRQSLERARAAFQPETIRELARLNTRLAVGSTLLSQHVAPSVLFDFLERETLSSVRFNSFSYGESGPGRVVVSMEGEARSFNAVALQSDAFGSSEIFSEVIFENLNINSTGNVTFNFSAVVNTRFLAYDADRVAPVAPAVPGNESVPENTNGGTVETEEEAL